MLPLPPPPTKNQTKKTTKVISLRIIEFPFNCSDEQEKESLEVGEIPQRAASSNVGKQGKISEDGIVKT